MDDGLNIMLQIVGVLSGALGAYFAYKQLQRDKPGTLSSPPVGSEVPVVNPRPEVFSCEPLQFFGDWVFLVACGLAGAAVVFVDGSEMPPAVVLVKLAVGACLLAIAAIVWDQMEAHWLIEVDETAIVVRSALRRRPEQKFEWARAQKLEISSVGNARILLFIPEIGNGVEPGIDSYSWDGSRGGYRICKIAAVRPSEEAFLTALEHHSSGRFQR